MQTQQPSDLDQDQQTATATTDRSIDTFDTETPDTDATAVETAANIEPMSDGFADASPESVPTEAIEQIATIEADAQPEQSPAEAAVDTSMAPPASEPTPTEPAVAEQSEQAVVEQNEPAATDAATAAIATQTEPSETDPSAAAPTATETDDGGSEAAPADGTEHPLFAEVAGAPHKVYLLGRVRKAITAAGESELADRLRALEADVLEQVAARTAAKEALIARAEELKDSTAWKVTGDAFKALFEEWKQVGAAGRELDDQLWAKFNVARGAFNERRAKHFEEREQVWSANREQKEALCVEAEALADSTNWKATAEAIRDLQARWKAVGSAGREKDEALWARFNTAKQRFFDRRAAAWEENRRRKEALVSDAEALKDSTDWRTTGDALKAMQAEWKNVGPAGREHEDELWTRFRAATQTFFDRRSSTFAERNKSERENLDKKQELCRRAEALAYTGDPLSAAREAKELQAQWKETGPVPRDQSEVLWARFREACDKIFTNASGERDRQQNEWHVRMREAMGRKREQLNSLRESITHDEANIERWRDSLSNLKPGGKSEEIGKGLEDKIIDVMNRIRDKQARVEELRSSINDIEAKLRE